MVKESIEDRCSRWHVTYKLTPIFQGAIGGHYGGFGFITPHDDFKEVLSRTFGKLLDTHVINNQKIRFEVAGQDFVLTGEGFVMQEVSYYVEDGPIGAFSSRRLANLRML